LFQTREIRKLLSLGATRYEPRSNLSVLFSRETTLRELAYDRLFSLAVISEKAGKLVRTVEESHPASGQQCFFNLMCERPLTAVLGYQLMQWTIPGCGKEQRWKEDSLFHSLMVLIRERSQEFQYGLYVANFNALTVLQFLEHSIHDVQSAPDEDVVLNHNFCAFHSVHPKKNVLGVPLLRGFRDVMVSCTTVYGPSLG